MTRHTYPLFALIILLIPIGCQSRQQNKETTDTTSRVISAPKNQATQAEKLIGKWVQPIPGQESQKQGFQLNSDGTASSINMHTLLYDKWQLKGDTLLLWNHSVGVKNPIAGIDTCIIYNLTDSTLILTRKPSLKLNYTREK
ncbi:lipocalin family protein [Solitalea lacus]|uniref:lipocalin family protein n=1 Tax=Solitalea lacus TaxID=2911172 RepID=UPI001EDA158B|nr:lipocalin family protein [Solitalea lacus]UKJ09265.1 lipocalin family protein [Solitalea lacus]